MVTRATKLQNSRKNFWFSENGPCKKCGSDKNLEYDHINPSTKDPKLKKNSGQIWSWSEEKRNNELIKCQVLCRVCHEEKSYLEQTKPLIHGTILGYRKGCRCPKCRKSNADYSFNYKMNKKLDDSSYTKKYKYIRNEKIDHQHGTLSKYNDKCRCELCKLAKKTSRRGITSFNKNGVEYNILLIKNIIVSSEESLRNKDKLYKIRREKWFQENGPCKKCGSSNRLSVDHIDPSIKDPELKINSSRIWQWSDKRRIPELAKCQVLCHSCHSKKTGLENKKQIVHGTFSSYANKCRCEICREFYSNYQKEKKDKKLGDLCLSLKKLIH